VSGQKKNPWEGVEFENRRAQREKGGPGTFAIILVGCMLVGAVIGTMAGWGVFTEWIDPFGRTYEAESMTAEELVDHRVHWFMIAGAIVGALGGAQLAWQLWPKD